MSVRVLVVDDSAVVRSIVTKMLAAADGVEVVGTAANGRAAIDQVAALKPDLVTMDVEMPEMDGITAVRELRRAGHRMPVIMLSTLTERGAKATIDALTAGASDYVAKPSSTGGLRDAVDGLAAELLPKLRALVPTRPAVPAPVVRARAEATGLVKLALIGSSTGGPAALSRLVGSMTAPPPVPVLVTQHMPAVFTRQLADRLDRQGRARVVEAEDGQRLEPGWVYVAPGGRHLEVAGAGPVLHARLSDAPPVNYCKPSVDVMLDSAARVLGARHLLVVMLTGMGADGSRAARDISLAGGRVIAQDEATSAVWGMPGATVRAGAAHDVLPLDEIGTAVERALKGSR